MELFSRAVCFAAERHDGQHRRLANAPYLIHPIEAAAIVGTMTGDEEVLSAAVLHDTVEDTGTVIGEIEELFGKRVAQLVMSETENKREELPEAETWRIRKEESLEILRTTDDICVKMLWLGDKLSNMRSFWREYQIRGSEMWNDFHQNDTDAQYWYYSTIAEYLSELGEYDAYIEYVSLVEKLFGGRKEM